MELRLPTARGRAYRGRLRRGENPRADVQARAGDGRARSDGAHDLGGAGSALAILHGYVPPALGRGASRHDGNGLSGITRRRLEADSPASRLLAPAEPA